MPDDTAPGAVELDYAAAQARLAELFAQAVVLEGSQQPIDVSGVEAQAASTVFQSTVQSFREALLGCALAACLIPDVDLTKPYVNQGARAFNGRTLDERVVNPLLRTEQVPCSKGPYLATFRRSVRFLPATRDGLRDKAAFDAMLRYLAALTAADQERRAQLARHLCREFVRLRSRSVIPLVRIRRMTLEQLRQIMRDLLTTPSGGRVPVFLVAALLETISDHYGLRWRVDVQAINAADAVSGAGGDVVVRDAANGIELVIEITLRPIDRNRVVATYVSKIAPQGLADYLFLHGDAQPTEEARQVAFGYFSQGHDITFLPVDAWLVHSLGLVGSRGRVTFLDKLLTRLDPIDVPVDLKLRWNALANALAARPAVPT